MKILNYLFLFLCLNVQAQDCAKYRTGTFEVDNKDGTVSVITRTEKFQIEKCPGVKTKDRIEWIDDCSYRLIPVKIKDKSGRIGDEVLTFTIIATTEHSYTVRISHKGEFIIDAKVFEKGYLKLK